MFPGKRFDGDEPEATPRHVVLVKAELNVAPTRPVKLWFRAFDIDDPTASGDEVDREDADEDNRTEAPYSKGRFVGNMEDIQEFEMDSATGEFRYQVPTQPGDNVKIVAAADKDFLEQLENDDVKLFEKGPVHTSKIVDKHIFKAEDSVAKARIRQPESWSTDTLTIWRKLFIEIDTELIVTRTGRQALTTRFASPIRKTGVHSRMTTGMIKLLSGTMIRTRTVLICRLWS